MKSSVHLIPNKHLENISKMFRKLYNEEQLSDVTLCCRDGTIKAHKIILATSSPYFHRIFLENAKADHPILIMHGVRYQHLHDLVELIYKGHIDVHPESLKALYDLAGEFQLSGISGVLREEVDKYEQATTGTGNTENTGGNHGRDTRFKGLKRVAVDFKDVDEKTGDVVTPPSKKPNVETNGNNAANIVTSTPKPSPGVSSIKIPLESLNALQLRVKVKEEEKEEEPTSRDVESEASGADLESSGGPKLSAWAKKQRKFQCNLCPSSFKRSSHLTRHQLVHTGERPFACDQCDKAFSRHDKLKHHIRKAHELETDFPAETYDYDAPRGSGTESPLPFVITRTETVDEASSSSSFDQSKRPRGRPRKYPPAAMATKSILHKRNRGRPRGNPKGENYDITNLPYGDLNYLTMPLQDTVLIEPLVEIKTEKEGSADRDKEQGGNNSKSSQLMTDDVSASPAPNIKDIESRIAKIGECTISVANH